MKKTLLITLIFLMPFMAEADITCKGTIGFTGVSNFSISDAQSTPHVSWSVKGDISSTFSGLGDVIKQMIPAFNDEIVKIDFKFNKSGCLRAEAEPLLHSCNVEGGSDLSKIEDITLSLASGKVLVLKAIPTMVVTMSSRSSVDLDRPGQMFTYKTFHASLYFEFHNPGSQILYADIFDIGNKEGNGIGSCQP